MALTDLCQRLSDELGQIRADGLWKPERVITSTQSGEIEVRPGGRVLNSAQTTISALQIIST